MEKTQTATEGVEKWYLHLIDIPLFVILICCAICIWDANSHTDTLYYCLDILTNYIDLSL